MNSLHTDSQSSVWSCGEGFIILKRLRLRHRGFLQATSEDWEHGMDNVLKCQLCPSTIFGNWEDFKCYCDFSEAHLLKIMFCEYCRDFFT